jgi:acetyltransferase-like isoleucine patch superfamily enzyme
MAANFIHPTAEVNPSVTLGEGTMVWNFVQIREKVTIGKLCTFGKGVYVDANVCIGNRVKVQNNASIFHGVTLEDGVFIGPHVCFTNDLYPRAINPDLSTREPTDWLVMPTRVCFGAAIGANSTIRCGVTIGKWAMVGAGSVVTNDVPAYGLVFGAPAALRGHVCPCGQRLNAVGTCGKCGFKLPEDELS